MRVSVNESCYGFDVFLEPDTVKEAALLIRLGMNAKKTGTNVYASATESGVYGTISVGRRQDWTSLVIGRK